MEGYKVIKEFSFAKKGDIFTKNNDLNVWELQKEDIKENSETHTSMMIDQSIVDKLVEENTLIWYSEDDECKCCDCCCDKLNAIKEYIDTLIDTYTKNYNELMEEYNEGGIQPCVKVEAETVYHNLNKVLNSIKDLINE